MLGNMVKSAANALLRPQIQHFAFRHALRMSKEDLLRGAKHGAMATAARIQESYASKSLVAIDDLLKDKAVDAELHKVLSSRVSNEASQADAAFDFEKSEATLSNVCLVIAPRRHLFEGDARTLKQVKLGTSLVVVGDEEDFLYSQATQEALLKEHGCTVRCEVTFESDGQAPQRYLYEASVQARYLLDADLEPDFEFALVDINNVASGNEYWARATDAGSFSIKDLSRIFS